MTEDRVRPDWSLPAACLASVVPLRTPAPPCAHCGRPSDGWPGPRRGDVLCRSCWRGLGDERWRNEPYALDPLIWRVGVDFAFYPSDIPPLPGPLARAANRKG